MSRRLRQMEQQSSLISASLSSRKLSQGQTERVVQKLRLNPRSIRKAHDTEMSGKMESNMSRCLQAILRKIQDTG